MIVWRYRTRSQFECGIRALWAMREHGLITYWTIGQGEIMITKYHLGDPCVYCGKSHDDVDVGNCPGIPDVSKLDAKCKQLLAENAHLRLVLKHLCDEAVRVAWDEDGAPSPFPRLARAIEIAVQVAQDDETQLPA